MAGEETANCETISEYPVPYAFRKICGGGYHQVVPTFPPWYEENLKEVASNWGYDRQPLVVQQQSLMSMLNALGIKGINDGASGIQALGANIQARVFANDNETLLRRTADDNQTALFRGLTLSGVLRHVDDNHVLTTEALASVIKNGEWVTAQEVNITATKTLENSTVQHIANMAQKAVDTAYGGVIGLGRLEVPQPLVVKMA
jgi:hypothetical protein